MVSRMPNHSGSASMLEPTKPFLSGEWAECAVDHYSSCRRGRKFQVLGCRPYVGSCLGERGQWVIEVRTTYGITAYFARNFINLSRGEIPNLPLIPKEKPPMASTLATFITFGIAVPEGASATHIEEALRGVIQGSPLPMVAGATYDDVAAAAKHAVETGTAQQMMLFQPIAVVEPIRQPRSRIRPLR